MATDYTIHKHSLATVPLQQLDLPRGADILSVGNQRGDLMLWFRRKIGEEKTESRTIVIRGTGHNDAPAPDAARFIGTVQMLDGDLILHVFERTA